jgi:SWI/SNF-related matrix-associated actin-dependent regulator of chromatin subfamily A containing DEAD/H box 1
LRRTCFDLGETKLALDEAVVRDDDGKENAPEHAMTTSLVNVLKQQFEKEQLEEYMESNTKS